MHYNRQCGVCLAGVHQIGLNIAAIFKVQRRRVGFHMQLNVSQNECLAQKYAL